MPPTPFKYYVVMCRWWWVVGGWWSRLRGWERLEVRVGRLMVEAWNVEFLEVWSLKRRSHRGLRPETTNSTRLSLKRRIPRVGWFLVLWQVDVQFPTRRKVDFPSTFDVDFRFKIGWQYVVLPNSPYGLVLQRAWQYVRIANFDPRTSISLFLLGSIGNTDYCQEELSTCSNDVFDNMYVLLSMPRPVWQYIILSKLF